MSRQNSREVSSVEVIINGSQPSIDRVPNETKPFDDVKVLLVKGERGDAGNPYDRAPEMDGIASSGTTSNYARGDHVHPSDTTKMTKGTDYVTAGKRASSTMGYKATAEGYDNRATASYSHAEGHATMASGECAHAGGYHANATHEASHAMGYYLETGKDHQMVVGQYNAKDYDAIFVVGAGSDSSHKKNAMEIDVGGNTSINGDVTMHGDMSVSITGSLTGGNLSVYKDITAGGSITDGSSNVLSDKLDKTAAAASVAHPLEITQGNTFKVFDGSEEIDLYIHSKSCKILASGWSSTVDANGYYTQTYHLPVWFDTYRGVDISLTNKDSNGVNDALPTAAQTAAYNLVDYFGMVDGTSVEDITLYAKNKPTTDFWIRVQGFCVVTV